jgi:acetyltransferase-like isoleucine patch superfamily enzyme
MLLKKVIYVLKSRPTSFYPYLRQTAKFMFTRLLYRIFRPKNIRLGKNVRIQEFSTIRVEIPESGITIGDHCIIWEKGRIEAVSGGKIEIGSYTEIARSTIVAKEHIHIGSFVGISHHVYIQDFLGHPTDPDDRKQERKQRLEWFFPRYDGHLTGKREEKHTFDPDTKPIRIEDNVMIYRNVLILRGVTIGEGVTIAANSVVTRDIPPYSLAAGNPAAVIKTLR